MSDSIYHMILKLLKNRIFGIKTHDLSFLCNIKTDVKIIITLRTKSVNH